MSKILKKQLVFIISIAIAIAVIIYGYIFSESLISVSGEIIAWVSNNFGWLYVLSVFAFIIFLTVIAMSKWGNIKLGKEKNRLLIMRPLQ